MAEPETVPDPDLKLDEHTINAINQAVGRHNQEMARLHKGALPGGAFGLITDLGGVISKYLPGIVQVLGQLAGKGGGIPSIGEFFAAGNTIFNGGKAAGVVVGHPLTQLPSKAADDDE